MGDDGHGGRPHLRTDEQAELLCLALAAIWSGLEREPIAGLRTPTAPGLAAIGASFVTLERDGGLLGCIGTLEAVRPLYEDVMQNAYRSAFHDPRLRPIDHGDYAAMDIKISVLTAPEPFAVESRTALLDALRPGVDGLVLSDGHRRSTFLPAVWEKASEPIAFLDLLLAKGGWVKGSWPEGLRVSRYRSVEFGEVGPRPHGAPLAVPTTPVRGD